MSLLHPVSVTGEPTQAIPYGRLSKNGRFTHTTDACCFLEKDASTSRKSHSMQSKPDFRPAAQERGHGSQSGSSPHMSLVSWRSYHAS